MRPKPLDYSSPSTPPYRRYRQRPRCRHGLVIAMLIAFAAFVIIVVVNFSGHGDRAPPRDGVARDELSRLQLAIEMFQTEVGRFPTDAEGLWVLARDTH